MIQVEEPTAAVVALEGRKADLAWDPTDDELDERWARFEAGWTGVPAHADPDSRHLGRFAVMIVALLVLAALAGVVVFALAQA